MMKIVNTYHQEQQPMPTTDCIIALFLFVNERMKNVPDHSQAKLDLDELVTLGLLYALKGESQSQFYRWLSRNYRPFFPDLPERTRLFRRLRTQQDWTDFLLASCDLLAIADSFSIELIHPRRAGRNKNSVGKKGFSNHRWVVGVKMCVLLNAQGRVVEWKWQTANVHDSHFRPFLAEYKGTAVLADGGFHGKKGDPGNLNICKRGQTNVRFMIETVFSLWERFLRLKQITERGELGVQAHMTYAVAAYNAVQELFGTTDANAKMSLRMTDISCNLNFHV